MRRFLSWLLAAAGGLPCHPFLRCIGRRRRAKKYHWLTEKVGFDAAIDYKDGQFVEQSREDCPGRIDLLFEHSGFRHQPSCKTDNAAQHHRG